MYSTAEISGRLADYAFERYIENYELPPSDLWKKMKEMGWKTGGVFIASRKKHVLAILMPASGDDLYDRDYLPLFDESSRKYTVKEKGKIAQFKRHLKKAYRGLLVQTQALGIRQGAAPA